MSNEEELPTFPDILPSSMRETRVYKIEEGDIQTDEDLRQLVTEMYDHPERDFHYFRQRVGAAVGPLDRAIAEGTILEDEAGFFWYPHPKYPHDYVHIEVRDGDYEWDWQKEVVERGPMFVRIKMKLPERKGRELEIKERIEAERAVNANPLELRPNFMGIGVDLFKAIRWMRQRLRR